MKLDEVSKRIFSANSQELTDITSSFIQWVFQQEILETESTFEHNQFFCTTSLRKLVVLIVVGPSTGITFGHLMGIYTVFRCELNNMIS